MIGNEVMQFLLLLSMLQCLLVNTIVQSCDPMIYHYDPPYSLIWFFVENIYYISCIICVDNFDRSDFNHILLFYAVTPMKLAIYFRSSKLKIARQIKILKSNDIEYNCNAVSAPYTQHNKQFTQNCLMIQKKQHKYSTYSWYGTSSVFYNLFKQSQTGLNMTSFF